MKKFVELRKKKSDFNRGYHVQHAIRERFKISHNSKKFNSRDSIPLHSNRYHRIAPKKRLKSFPSAKLQHRRDVISLALTLSLWVSAFISLSAFVSHCMCSPRIRYIRRYIYFYPWLIRFRSFVDFITFHRTTALHRAVFWWEKVVAHTTREMIRGMKEKKNRYCQTDSVSDSEPSPTEKKMKKKKLRRRPKKKTLSIKM